jgi:hypothetical protein
MLALLPLCVAPFVLTFLAGRRIDPAYARTLFLIPYAITFALGLVLLVWHFNSDDPQVGARLVRVAIATAAVIALNATAARSRGEWRSVIGGSVLGALCGMAFPLLLLFGAGLGCPADSTDCPI